MRKSLSFKLTVFATNVLLCGTFILRCSFQLFRQFNRKCILSRRVTCCTVCYVSAVCFIIRICIVAFTRYITSGRRLSASLRSMLTPSSMCSATCCRQWWVHCWWDLTSPRLCCSSFWHWSRRPYPTAGITSPFCRHRRRMISTIRSEFGCVCRVFVIPAKWTEWMAEHLFWFDVCLSMRSGPVNQASG